MFALYVSIYFYTDILKVRNINNSVLVYRPTGVFMRPYHGHIQWNDAAGRVFSA